MSKIIKDWDELSKVPPNDKYKIIIEDCCGWIVPIEETPETTKEWFKHHYYLSTHTFYGKTGTPNILKEYGWDLELDNWDKEEEK